MQNFIKNHPNSVYISNAYFWLAEFNLAIEPTNYSEAKKNFEIVAKIDQKLAEQNTWQGKFYREDSQLVK